MAYLKTHEVSAAQARSLGLYYLASPEAGHLKVLTYAYASGGARGIIHRPVWQWKNADGHLFAYAAHEEGYFHTLYRLASPGRTHYLLLGAEQGSRMCTRGRALLLELKGNYLLLDKQAFDQEPTLDICNAEMTYDARRQALTASATSEAGAPFTLYFSHGRFIRKK